jgi:hypothetical protein
MRRVTTAGAGQGLVATGTTAAGTTLVDGEAPLAALAFRRECALCDHCLQPLRPGASATHSLGGRAWRCGSCAATVRARAWPSRPSDRQSPETQVRNPSKRGAPQRAPHRSVKRPVDCDVYPSISLPSVCRGDWCIRSSARLLPTHTTPGRWIRSCAIV